MSEVVGTLIPVNSLVGQINYGTRGPKGDTGATGPQGPKGDSYPIAGSNISIVNNVISVITTDTAEQDNTKPITSGGVYTVVGNIETLLETI